MSTAFELIGRIEASGGHFMLDGERLGITPERTVLPILEEVRRNKVGIIALLQRRSAMPPGVRLLQWKPLAPPVQLNRHSTVVDTEKFAERTLQQLGARLRGDDWGAGNWSVSQLIDRLESVGVAVELLETSRWVQ
jgi:hypothetical protein